MKSLSSFLMFFAVATLFVRDVILKTGAGFIVVLAGKIMTMPGLPKIPAAEKIDIDKDGEIVGIF